VGVHAVLVHTVDSSVPMDAAAVDVLVPVIPFVLLFDGVVSCLRTYRPEELREISQKLSAQDISGRLANKQGVGARADYLFDRIPACGFYSRRPERRHGCVPIAQRARVLRVFSWCRISSDPDKLRIQALSTVLLPRFPGSRCRRCRGNCFAVGRSRPARATHSGFLRLRLRDRSPERGAT